MESGTENNTDSGVVVGGITPETGPQDTDVGLATVEIPLAEDTKKDFDDNGVSKEIPQTADDRLNAMVLNELEQVGGKHAWTVFFETGQISTFIIKDREKLESRIVSGGNVIEIPEAQEARGFTNGKVFVHKDQIVFSILRDKSAIIQPDRKLVLASR